MRIKRASLRQRKNGSYIIDYYFNKKRQRIGVGSDMHHAVMMLKQFNDWLFNNQDPLVEYKKELHREPVEVISLKEFYPLFMERHGKLQSRNMQHLYCDRFKHLMRCKQVVEIPMNTITKKLILDYMYARVNEDASNATVNREANVVKSMLSRAVEWGIIDTNPIKGLKLFKEAPKREVTITPDQVAALLDELPISIADIVEFAIYSGLRKSEILNLKVKDIRFDEMTIKIKSGRTESFPVGPDAQEVLKRAIGQRFEGYVFVNPKTMTKYRSILRTFDRAVNKLNLKVGDTKLRFHDLRHVFGSWLYKYGGVGLDDIRILMGHKDRSTTDRYVTASMSDASKKLKLMPKIRRKN